MHYVSYLLIHQTRGPESENFLVESSLAKLSVLNKVPLVTALAVRDEFTRLVLNSHGFQRIRRPLKQSGEVHIFVEGSSKAVVSEVDNEAICHCMETDSLVLYIR